MERLPAMVLYWLTITARSNPMAGGKRRSVPEGSLEDKQGRVAGDEFVLRKHGNYGNHRPWTGGAHH